MGYDRKYLLWALGYAVVGMALGIYMAASHNHTEYVAHAHINLIGFLLSLVYGIIHKLWLVRPNPAIARIQFIVHQAGSVVIAIGLFLLYGSLAPIELLDPILAVASFAILASALLMFYMVVKTGAVTA